MQISIKIKVFSTRYRVMMEFILIYFGWIKPEVGDDNAYGGHIRGRRLDEMNIYLHISEDE